MLIDFQKIPKGWYLSKLGSQRTAPTGKNGKRRHLSWHCVLEHESTLFPSVDVRADGMQLAVNWAIEMVHKRYPESLQ